MTDHMIYVLACFIALPIGAFALLMFLFSGPSQVMWGALAWLVTREKVFVWLLRRAFRTPYSHITSADGSDVYMRRFWLFNPYGSESGERLEGSDAAPRRSWWREMLPSVRIHHIKRADQDRHLHDHPWNARTIILKGWYEEERYADESPRGAAWRQLKGQTRKELGLPLASGLLVNTERQLRVAGYTGRLLFKQYHRITKVPNEGVWTLFITWRKRGSWGFDVDGHKVPWREYLAQHSGNTAELPITLHERPASLKDLELEMTERAGAPYQSYAEAGWTLQQLIDLGYVRRKPAPPADPGQPAERTT